MKLNEQELNKLNETNKFIIEWCDYFADFEDDLIFSEDRIKEIIEEEEDIQEIVYEFPGVDDYTEIDVKEILELSDEIKTIQVESKSLIKTKLRRYYIISSTESNDDYFLREYHDLQLTSLDDIEINLVSESFIVGLAATKLEEYDKDYWGTINQYLAIEIIYKNEEKILDNRNEKELLDSYIFEVADSTGIALILSEIRNPVDEFEELR